MKVHYLQHVPFEGLGYLEPWLTQHGHTISATHLYAGEALPDINDVDWLIVMGGPMSVNDEDEHEWLVSEKEFIKQAIDHGKYVLGICLGAQLIAVALGSQVYKHTHREIGWFPINLVPGVTLRPGTPSFPETFEAFHWHGDTFHLPANTVHLASSAGCPNQAFLYGDHVLALQFHLEATQDTAAALIQHCGEELAPGQPYVQSSQEILATPERFAAINSVISNMLGSWIK